MLTEQQVRHFHDEGYLFLPETFTAEECAFLRDEAVELFRIYAAKAERRGY